MTDNEKRAHDLAIILTAEAIKPENLIRDAAAKGEKTLNVNPYQTYKSIYDSVLFSLNGDYPGQ